PGRVRLEQDLGCAQPLRTRAVRFMRRLGWPGMALSILALTLLLMWAATVALAEYGLTPGALWMLVLLFALPASEAATGMFNSLVTLFIKPTRLIGYDYKDAIPDDARTL